ncbi:hypothetical protein [Sphaerisporangium corydalis]|uniref:Uncharacterized protein n=1 Tax=Sphaerisporangium corydalis TaxID=1441875 RepID=A0ABV9EGH5_9ACTN|nr:hypothetical protein [Sphaerisporangium corydalis]
MAPEIHYQLITSRVAELQQEAADHRLARLAVNGKNKESGERSHPRLRAAFGKLRTS